MLYLCPILFYLTPPNSSTNALIHLIAIAGRVGIKLTLEDFDTLGRDVPTIVNLMPSGEYLMEEFYYAGGLPVVIRALIEKGHLSGDLMTVSGQSHRTNVADAKNFDEKVIMHSEAPLAKPPHICVLTKGNLAQNGAVIKVSAASKHLLRHTGRACVFKDIDDYNARIDDEELDCDENSVLVLQNCGLRGEC
jgi:L-arabonate dehydrase